MEKQLVRNAYGQGYHLESVMDDRPSLVDLYFLIAKFDLGFLRKRRDFVFHRIEELKKQMVEQRLTQGRELLAARPEDQEIVRGVYDGMIGFIHKQIVQLDLVMMLFDSVIGEIK